ncbi:MAG: flagellar basal-body rod protein FlgF [Polynucleobacter sp.]|nr:flagellar basal-body rod protein FlgF [Polynucleobacter sp.]
MDRLIYTAMSGASQTLSRQAAVAQNLANVSTTGYRAAENRLQAVQVQSNAQQKGLATRAFAMDASSHTDFTPGPMMLTGRPLDLAVQGAGWIALQLPDGSEAYTRSNSFETNANGIVQTRNGVTLQGDGGSISIPPDTRISVGVDGTISALPESGAKTTVSVIGRVKLVNPPLSELVRGEDGLFRMRDRSAAPADESIRVAAGNLESSNVNPAEQMVSMISLARQFEMQMKVLTTAVANDRSATQILSTR